MADLTSEQRRVASELIRIGRARGASPKEIKAALETAAVEKNFTNTGGGDSDSSNWRQERASVYGPQWAKTGGALNLEASANRFYDEAAQFNKTGQYGSAGQLAAAVQRPAAQYRDRYQTHSALADALLGGASPTGGSGNTPSAAAPTSSAPAAPPSLLGASGGDYTSLLTSLLAPQAQAPPSAPLQAPAFSSALKMPTGALALAPSPQVQAGGQDRVSAALSLVQALGAQDPTEPQAAAPATAEEPGAVPIAQKVMQTRSKGRLTPTATVGKVIGTPNAGTHTLGNWQSDNAVDIAVPVGTPMVALQDGIVVKVTKHPQGSGRFAGDQVTIRGANGNEYFYAHGVADVKAGQTIKRGQALGTTGSANGVAHLHFGQMNGDPRKHTR